MIKNYIYFLAVLAWGYSCSYGADTHLNDDFTILSPTEFSKKMERFAPIFKRCKQIDKSRENPITSTIEKSEDTMTISVPETGVIVQPKGGKKIQVETTPIYSCVGIVGWNSEYIGCTNVTGLVNTQNLQKFVNDITKNNNLKDTTFLLVTNYLSNTLENLYQFIDTNVPDCEIILEAEFDHGGYVIVEPLGCSIDHEYHNQENQNTHFIDTQTRELKPINPKSISIRSHFGRDEIPYSFTAHDSSMRIEEYFANLRDEACNLNPSNYWEKNYSSYKDREPKMVWVIANRIYNYFKEINIRAPHERPYKDFIYLYDSKDQLPQ